MDFPIITNAKERFPEDQIRGWAEKLSWKTEIPMDVVKAVVEKFGMSKAEATRMVREMYDEVTYPDMSRGMVHELSGETYQEPRKNGLGVEVPITTGTSLAKEKENARVVVPGDFVQVHHEGAWVAAKVLGGNKDSGWRVKLAKSGDTVTVKDEDLKKEAGFRNEDLERVENPSWMKDEPIWKKAKEAVGPGDGDSHWAQVTAVYKKMGGRIK